MKFFSAIFTLLILMHTAIAADFVTGVDKLKSGKSSSGSDKIIEFDIGSGAANPKLRYHISTSKLQFAHDGSTFTDLGKVDSTIGASQGGTGLTSPGTSGNVLTSNGSAWISSSASATLSYFSGYMSGASHWVATSSTFVDGVNTGGNALTTIYSSGITVVAAAGNIAGLTITPASASDVFEVTATSAISDNGTTFIEAARLFDGTTDLGHSGAHLDSGNTQSGIAPITIDAIWAPATTSPVTIKVQLNGNDGGGAEPITLGSQTTGIRSINWTIKQIK